MATILHMDCDYKSPLGVGSDVPDFTLETYEPGSGNFSSIALSDIQKSGKWTVLVFYPADFTFVCPTELADLAERNTALEEAGAKVVSISCDTKFCHLAWKSSERLLEDVTFTMGSDPTGTVSRMFGVYDEATGLALRGTFIINPTGKLISSEINYYDVGRDADELLRKIKANAYIAEHPAEACPAKWRPGDKTLTPDEDMVGSVWEELNT